MIPYRELEHTADVGLEIYGNTIEELFINGLKGLFHFISPRIEPLIAVPPKNSPEKRHYSPIKLSALTREELLVHWLNEFVYCFFVKKTYPKILKITDLTGKNLEAEVDFEKCGEEFQINMEIKAATYHNISIKRFDSKYSARVIFDV